MDLARLTEFEELFGHRYEALTLVCLLEDGPMRWSDIGRAMDRRSNVRVPDRYVTRSLQALEKGGYVQAVDADNGHGQLRTLTSRGVGRAKRIADIFTNLDQQDGRAGSTTA